MATDESAGATLRGRPRVLLVVGKFDGNDVRSAVAAWTMAALRTDFALTLLTLTRPDWQEIDRRWGTDLADGGVAVRHLRPAPLLGADANRRRLVGAARRMLGGFELVIGLDDETDFGVAGIQFIDQLHGRRGQQAADWVWDPNTKLGSSALLRWLCQLITPFRLEGMRQNITLCTSYIMTTVIREAYGVDAAVLYPPVPLTSGGPDWSEKRDSVLCVCADPGAAIEIMEGVRRRGHPLGLTLVTPASSTRNLRAEARDWVTVVSNLSAGELAESCGSHRFALDLADQSGFPLWVGVLMRSGGVLLPRAGGVGAELVEQDQRLKWAQPAEAVERLSRLLASPGSLRLVREHLQGRSERLTPDAFGTMLKGIVALILRGSPKPRH